MASRLGCSPYPKPGMFFRYWLLSNWMSTLGVDALQLTSNESQADSHGSGTRLPCTKTSRGPPLLSFLLYCCIRPITDLSPTNLSILDNVRQLALEATWSLHFIKNGLQGCGTIFSVTTVHFKASRRPQTSNGPIP